MVEDQRLTPTFTADLAAGLIAAVEAGERGVLHMTNSGECSWYEFTREIFSLGGVDAAIEPVTTTIPPGGVDRPLNGVLATRSQLEPLRPWQDALADYMARAGLRSGVAQSP